MATVLTHPVVAIALFPWFQSIRGHKLILLTGMILSTLPDLDVIGYWKGIPYQDLLGHRGLSHSLPFALIFTWPIAWIVNRREGLYIAPVWFYFFLCMSSHGLLDAMTNGGLGVALFAPIFEQRYFLAFRPIEVSPLSIERFFSGSGIRVFENELLWVWVPAIFIAVLGLFWSDKK